MKMIHSLSITDQRNFKMAAETSPINLTKSHYHALIGRNRSNCFPYVFTSSVIIPNIKNISTKSDVSLKFEDFAFCEIF